MGCGYIYLKDRGKRMTLDYNGNIHFPVELTVTFVGPQREITGMDDHSMAFSAPPPLSTVLGHLYWIYPGLENKMDGFVTVNGKIIQEDYEFQHGDNIMIVPHIGGG